jgi:ribonuclease J
METGMRVCIHRGTREIGGTCVELECQGARLVLDLGLPLDADGPSETLLPPVSGFRESDPSLLGVVLSHPHHDHVGLARLLPPSVPLVMGAAAERILAAAAPFLPDGAPLQATHHLWDRAPLQLGPFRITPYLMDHSAYDSYAVLVEAGGRRLFYSGDLRAHGRKAALFERLLQDPPSDVDALLMEGSTIGRLAGDERFPTEADLELAMAEIMRATSGAVLVHASAQNIDRVVSVFRACRRAGRAMVIDLYAATILAATGNSRIPQSDWDDVHLFVPSWQRRRVVQNKMFDQLKAHATHRVFPEHLPALAPRAVLMVRPSMARDLEAAACLQGARLIWSQWEGYLRDDGFRPFLQWAARLGIPMDIIHTSGHASIADLRRFAEALGAQRLVPIHSFETGRFAEFFPRVENHEDGEWWTV